MKINELLLETVDGKNLHLEHLDDEIWNRGYQGAEEAINYIEGATNLLKGNTNQRYFATKKWDGSPALFVGTDPETGQFVMGDKGIFAKTKENKIFKAEDIDTVKPDKVKGGEKIDYSGLRNKLKIAFNYLKDLNYDGKILQGDLLWTKGDGANGFRDKDDAVTPVTILEARDVTCEEGGEQHAAQAVVGVDLLLEHTELVADADDFLEQHVDLEFLGLQLGVGGLYHQLAAAVAGMQRRVRRAQGLVEQIGRAHV